MAAGKLVAELNRLFTLSPSLELYLQAYRDPGLRPAAMRCFAAYDRLAGAALRALGVSEPDAVATLMVAIIDGLQLRRLASGQRELAVAEPLEALLAALGS